MSRFAPTISSDRDSIGASAERQARVEFGRHARYKEEARESVAGHGLELLVADLRLAGRGIRRGPAFAATVILTFALAIAGTTATVALVDAVLYRPLPFAEPARVFFAAELDPKTGAPSGTIPASTYVALRDAPPIEAATSFSPTVVATMMTASGARAMRVMTATVDVFRVVGLPLAAGRSFTSAEAVADEPVALLTYSAWKREFNGDRGVIGRAIDVDGKLVTIVGVMSKDFWLPGLFTSTTPDLLAPERVPTNPGPRDRAFVIVRVRRNVSQASAQSALRTVARRHVETTPGHPPLDIGLVAVREMVAPNLSTTLLALLAAVGLVLVIACVNVGNITLARGRARRAELAVRIAIGASRTRIVRLLITESVVLAVIGGILGLALAKVAIAVGVSRLPVVFRRLPHPQFDARLLWVGLGVTVLSALVVSIVPAMRLTRADLLPSIAGVDVIERRSRLAGVAGGVGLLIGVEVALALVLLAGAALMARTVVNLQRIDIGFDPSRLAVIGQRLPRARYGDSVAAIAHHLAFRRQLRENAGIRGVASADIVPFGGTIATDRVTIDGGQPVMLDVRRVSAGYFALLGMRIVRGSLFRDGVAPATEAVVNEAFMRAYADRQPVLGRTIATRGGPVLSIVGVVSDARETSIDKAATPAVYLSIDDPGFRRAAYQSVLVTTSLPVLALQNIVTRVESDLDPTVLVAVTSLDDARWRPFASSRFYSAVLGGFALVALILAGLGLGGVIAESVSRKRREIGIRLALGAQRSRVVVEISRRYLAAVVAGLAAGAAGCWYSTRALASLLYDVAPRDPAILGGAAATLLLVAVASSILPAYRATRINPIWLLRR